MSGVKLSITSANSSFVHASVGRLYCFEGLDGSGKSTQIRLLSARLSDANVPHAVFRSPGGTPLADELRALLRRNDFEIREVAAEVLLHLAAILDCLKANILPSLEQGRVVLLDRFVYSTAAYQGVASQQLRDKIVDLSHTWIDLSIVSRVFLLDIDPARAIRRMELRTDAADRYDQLPLHQKEVVRENYLTMASSQNSLFKIVDADRDPAIVAQDIWEDVSILVGRQV